MTVRQMMSVLVVLVLVAAGCAGRAQKATPEKVNPFPDERFLTATASGATEMEAGNHALAELSQVFESRVYSETSSRSHSLMGASLQEQFEKEVDSFIRIHSSVELKGARIGELRRDPDSRLFYATAVLDRQQAGRQWQEELDQVEGLMEAEYQALPQVAGKLPRMIALNSLVTLSLKRAVVESRLRVVGWGGDTIFDRNMQPIYDERAALKNEIKFYVGMTGEYGRSAARLMAKVMTGNGLRISLQESEADARIQGRVEIQPLKLNNPDIHYVRATVTILLEDAETGVQVGTISEDIRKGYIDRDEAIRRAVEQAAGMVADKLLQLLKLVDPVSVP